jgi:hypothetical protein
MEESPLEQRIRAEILADPDLPAKIEAYAKGCRYCSVDWKRETSCLMRTSTIIVTD